MLVKEVMARPVFTVDVDASFEKIVKILAKKSVSGVTVVNKKGKVVGVISEKDLLHKLFPKQRDFYKDIEYYRNFKKIELDVSSVFKVKAKKLMTRNVVTIDPERHVLVACSLMAIHDIRRLPVVKNGKVVGIVTMGTLYKKYLSSFL